MDHFDDVNVRTGPDTCARCRQRFKRHQRLMEVKLVAGIGNSPSGSGKTLYISETQEFIHADCKDRLLNNVPVIIMSKPKPSIDESLHLRARVESYVCVRCKKHFVREDRVTSILIVEGTALDKTIGHVGTVCSDEFEMVHIDCKDPQLNGGALIL